MKWLVILPNTYIKALNLWQELNENYFIYGYHFSAPTGFRLLIKKAII